MHKTNRNARKYLARTPGIILSSFILAIPTLKGCREYWCDWGWSLKQKCVKCWLLHCTAPWLPSWLRANLRSQVHTKHTKYGRVRSSQIVLEQQIIGQLCLTTEGMAHLICFRKSLPPTFWTQVSIPKVLPQRVWTLAWRYPRPPLNIWTPKWAFFM